MAETTFKANEKVLWKWLKFIFILLRVLRQVTEGTECFQDGREIQSCMWEIEQFKSALVVEKNKNLLHSFVI